MIILIIKSYFFPEQIITTLDRNLIYLIFSISFMEK